MDFGVFSGERTSRNFTSPSPLLSAEASLGYHHVRGLAGLVDTDYIIDIERLANSFRRISRQMHPYVAS